MIEYYGYDSESDRRYERDWEQTWDDEDPLVRRLRAMTWAEVPAELRQRCWEDIKQRIDELRARGAAPGVRRPAEACDRYAFSRRREPCHTFVPRRLVSGEPRQLRSASPAWAFR